MKYVVMQNDYPIAVCETGQDGVNLLHELKKKYSAEGYDCKGTIENLACHKTGEYSLYFRLRQVPTYPKKK